MRVLEINTLADSGCTGRIAACVYNEVVADGGQCAIAYGRGAASTQYDAYRIGNRFDQTVHGLITRIFDMHGLGSKTATIQFLNRIDEYNPDIIHLHNIHGYYINFQLLFDYIKRNQIPVVWTLHDCWPFTGHCPYFTYVGCEKWKTGCHHCIKKKEHPASYVFDRSEKNYSEKRSTFTGVPQMTIVTPSYWLASLVKQSFLSQYPVEVIHNGIRSDTFKPTASDFRKQHHLENKKMILGVANLWFPTKGLSYMLELAQQLDPHRFQVVIVGLSKQQAEKMPTNIIAICKTDSAEELAQIYSAADVFVNPTLEDNFPTTNLEALACGTPVVTFCTGGSSESIDETCGIVTKEKTTSALIDACVTITTGESMKDACLKKATEFSEKIVYQRYIALYKKLISDMEKGT